MIDGAPRTYLPALYWVGVGLVLAWNLVAAAQSSRVRRRSPWLASLTSLAGFLLPPALLVAIVAPSALDGRTLHVIAWLWPLTATLAGVQAAAALARGQTPRWIGIPLAIYGVLVALLATARWGIGTGLDVGIAGTALLVAQQATLAPLLGAEALGTGRALLIPVLAPLIPARWIAGSIARPVIAIATAACSALLCLVALPRAVRAVDGFQTFARVVPAERTQPDLQLGLRILGPLSGPPPSLAVRNDLALMDTIGVQLALVVVRPAGSSRQALDSLARVLAPFRSDSVPMQLGVVLGHDPGDVETMRTDPDALRSERLGMLERVMRVVRPDVVFPAEPPRTHGRRAPDVTAGSWWQEYLSEAAIMVHHLRPRTRVGLTLDRFDKADSALYVWATSSASPVELVAFELFPSLDGAAGLEARLTTADRWMAAAPVSKPHWVIAGSYPYVFGEGSQRLAIRHVRAWAASTGLIEAFVIADAADYDRLTGLRSSGGRIREAGHELRESLTRD